MGTGTLEARRETERNAQGDLSVVTHLARLAKRLRRRFDELLEPYGLTSVQLGLLNRLARSDGAVQADLGRSMQIEPATLTGIVQRMERDGWVRRSEDLENRRLQRVWLSDRALEALPSLRRVQARHHRRATVGLSPENLTELEKMLSVIEENLKS